jgi:hypothetical protein
MNYLFENIYFKNSQGRLYDELINGSYWVILLTKNILKILFAAEYQLTSLLLIMIVSPLLRFFAIGLGNIYKFKKYNKVKILIFIMSTIVLIESFFELPLHYVLTKNVIYLHTNNFKIYDSEKYRNLQIGTEFLENIIILLFFAMSIFVEKKDITIIAILTFVFAFIWFIYNIIAIVYFSLFKTPEEAFEIDEYGRETKKSMMKRAERDQKNRQETNKSHQEEQDVDTSTNRNLVEGKKNIIRYSLTNKDEL